MVTTDLVDWRKLGKAEQQPKLLEKLQKELATQVTSGGEYRTESRMFN